MFENEMKAAFGISSSQRASKPVVMVDRRFEYEEGQKIWSARFSKDIQADFKLGYSLTGHHKSPAASEEELKQLIWEGKYETYVTKFAYLPEFGGWHAIHKGLCAVVGDSKKEVLQRVYDSYATLNSFPTTPLYAFRAEFIEYDLDGSASPWCGIVKPLSDPQFICHIRGPFKPADLRAKLGIPTWQDITNQPY